MRENKLYLDTVIVLMILFACIYFAAILGIHRYGDGAGYYLMALSFSKDGDFILDNRDIVRWNKDVFEDVPAGTYILKDNQGILRYGKPILYALIAAPFALFGAKGLEVLNGLLLGGSIALCYLFLKNYIYREYALCFAGLFFFCSFLPAYTAWLHPEIMFFFFCVLCMWLWIGKGKAIFSAFIIGIASSARPTFVLLILPMIILLFAKKKYRELRTVIMICCLGLGSMAMFTFLFLKTPWPYAGMRGILPVSKTPYLALSDVKNAIHFSLDNIDAQLRGIDFCNIKLFSFTMLHFFIGRFTGLIWYSFPGIVCVTWYFLFRKYIRREEKIVGDSILLVTFLLIVILITSRPLNYFGGGDFICNRYLFIIPALLFLPTVRLLKNNYTPMFFFLPGLLISSQILCNELKKQHWQPHTVTFPLKYAPLEIAQVECFIRLNFNISDNIRLYFPLGAQIINERQFLLDKGQELVIVINADVDCLSVDTDRGLITLKPKIKLRNEQTAHSKTFFYFKPIVPTLIDKNSDVFQTNRANTPI